MKLLKKIYYFIFCHSKLFLHINNIGKNSIIRFPRIIQKGEYINLGKNVNIYKNSRLSCYDKYYGEDLSPSIHIGDYTDIRENFTVLSANDVIIGEHVLIAGYVLITNLNHGIDPLQPSFGSQHLTTKKTIVQDGVWIGEKSCVLAGVTIGKKSIIGAGSVVTKDIPAYSIAVGNPARVIKKFNFEKNRWQKVTS